MKRFLFLGIVAATFWPIFNTQAAEITNVEIRPAESTTIIEWDALSDTILYQTNGYAIQWDSNQNKMTNQDIANIRQYTKTSTNFLNVRTATFEPNEVYYLRVYTYLKDGRTTILSNGSKLYKFKFKHDQLDGDVEVLESNDPIIANNSSDGSSFEFGKLRVAPYDTYATFSWSRPDLIKSEFDGIKILVSETASFSNPLVELKTGQDITSGKVAGLTPEKTYYAKPYFYKNVAGEQQNFGDSAMETFTTKKKFSASQIARIERLQERGLIKDHSFVTAYVGGTNTQPEEDTTSSTTDTTSSSSTSSSSSSSSSSTTTSSSSTSWSLTEIKNKIRDLQSELSLWQNRLREKEGGSNSSSVSNSSSSSSSSGSSLKYRICMKLGRGNCDRFK
ncbi:hypothetical protein K9M41_01020 [Candidatus Gracilibacteria bacterium]|nr:hypothetical protein [Candidatus Gracilibacteria bacterium]